ncbi:MAG: MFS transporter [Proteobacteria bacterium]|nr:MFS transporter [Pseudomonadota bacterium]
MRHYRGLRDLWLGKLVSFVGDWFNAVALLTAVQELSSSAQALTLVMLARTVAVFIISPFAGRLIDRVDRRYLLLIVDSLRAAGALGLLIAYQQGSLVGLYVGLVGMMFCAGIAVPTQHAIVPELVDRAHVSLANGLLAGTWAIMAAAGAALGGLATQYLGISASLLIDAMTFVVSLGMFARLPRLKPISVLASARSARFAACLAYLARRPYVLSLALVKPMLQLLGGLMAFLPLFGTSAFATASGSLYIGILFASRGLGAAVGAIVLRGLFGTDATAMRRWIAPFYVLIAISYAALAVATAFWQAALAVVGVGIGHSAGWVVATSLLQLDSDRQFHGRLFSLEFGLSMLLMASSGLAAGAALDGGMSLQSVTAVFAGLALLPALLWSVLVLRPALGTWRVRRIQFAIVSVVAAVAKNRRHD